MEKNSPPIDITRKLAKFEIVAFNQNFDHDDVIKMKKYITEKKEKCLSYNILKSGRKWVNSFWVTRILIWKIFWNKIKSNFLTSDDDIMTSQCIVSISRLWNHICNSYSIWIWEKIWGSMDVLKSYSDFKKGVYLPLFAIFQEFTSARSLCLRRARDVIFHRKWLKICECSKKSV